MKVATTQNFVFCKHAHDSLLVYVIWFDRALRTAAILSAATTEELLEPRTETGRGTRYAYGFEIRDAALGRAAGHNGHHYGISSQFDMFLDTGWTVVVLSNYDPPAATVVAQKIRRTLERIPSSSNAKR